MKQGFVPSIFDFAARFAGKYFWASILTEFLADHDEIRRCLKAKLLDVSDFNIQKYKFNKRRAVLFAGMKLFDNNFAIQALVIDAKVSKNDALSLLDQLRSTSFEFAERYGDDRLIAAGHNMSLDEYMNSLAWGMAHPEAARRRATKTAAEDKNR